MPMSPRALSVATTAMSPQASALIPVGNWHGYGPGMAQVLLASNRGSPVASPFPTPPMQHRTSMPEGPEVKLVPHPASQDAGTPRAELVTPRMVKHAHFVQSPPMVKDAAPKPFAFPLVLPVGKDRGNVASSDAGEAWADGNSTSAESADMFGAAAAVSEAAAVAVAAAFSGAAARKALCSAGGKSPVSTGCSNFQVDSSPGSARGPDSARGLDAGRFSLPGGRSCNAGSDCSDDSGSSCSSSSSSSCSSHEEDDNHELSEVGAPPSSNGTTVPKRRDCITMEHRRFLRAADKERKWLRRALSQEVREVADMERRDRLLAGEEAEQAERRQLKWERLREKSVRQRQVDAEKWAEDKQAERIERRAARKEFKRRSEELRRLEHEEEAKKKAYDEQQCREAEKRLRRKEEEVFEKEEAERHAHEERVHGLQAVEIARDETLEQHRQEWLQAYEDAKQAREARAQRALELSSELESKRLSRLEEKRRWELGREQRIARERAQQQEQTLELSACRSSRRSQVQNESERLVKDRRDSISVQVHEKVGRVDELSSERHRLKEFRKIAQNEARRAIELVKQEVARQAVSSKYSPEKIQQQVDSLLEKGVLPPSAQREALLGEASPRSSRGSPRMRRTSGGTSPKAVAAWSPSRRRTIGARDLTRH